MKKANIKIIKSNKNEFQSPIKKSEHTEQLKGTSGDWIPHDIDLRGLKELVLQSTILPQCIKAYKSNIAGFGICADYVDDIDENEESKKEWDILERLLDLLNFDTAAKEVFEKLIEERETYGIAYLECIRNMAGELVGIEVIKDTPSIDMTYPLEPYIDVQYFYKGELISRRKKFRKFRQVIGGTTIYFKEFGDPRVMDKNTGEYRNGIDIDNQANELLDFTIGAGYYGTVRWMGQVLTIDGNYRAEILNNKYFRNGRHTPLMIIVKGGTLSDESFVKLQTYMEDIQGEAGQHAFMVIETEENEISTGLEEKKNSGVEIKDLASILQTDELFQAYQENGRKKIQSAFLLPDLYVGYTTDFNRSTAQVAMEITEKQVFQPERASLAWAINKKILGEYGFKYVQAKLNSPDITNPEDVAKMLDIAERAGGLTLNDGRNIAMETLGRKSENYPETFNMQDIGNVPLSAIKSIVALSNYDYGTEVMGKLQGQIEKADKEQDYEVVAVMKEVKRLILQMGGE